MTAKTDVLSLRYQRTHRHCWCWRITRTDNTVVRITDHDVPLEVNEDVDQFYAGTKGVQTFTPATGIIASAQQHAGQLKDHNVDLRGVVLAAAITTQDLWAGLWRGAEVMAYKVDWMYPFLGPLRTCRYWVDDIEFDRGVWRTTCTGLSRFLKRSKGRNYGKHCDVKRVGDSRCGATITAWTYLGGSPHAVDSVEDKLKFECPTSYKTKLQTAGEYDDGHIEWKTGDNAGVVSEIRTQDNVHMNGATQVTDITLHIPTPFPIKTSDTFDIYPGCDKDGTASGDCINKFDNIINFRAFQFLPGNDAMMKGP